MNNKGFTLIELLAVLVILVSISFVVVANISSSLEKRDIKECEEQQALAVNYAKIYFSLSETSDSEVNVGTLKTKGYFKENQKTDRLSDSDIISISSFEYKYNGKSIGDSCK